MITMSTLGTIPSETEAIRYIECFFDYFSVDQIDITKSIISEYFMTKVANFVKNSHCVFNVDNNYIQRTLVPKNIKIYKELENKILIYCDFFGKPEKKLVIYVKAPKNISTVDNNHIKQCVKTIIKAIASDVIKLLNLIDNSIVKPAYFIQDIALWDADFNGVYDFGVMRVDFGPPDPARRLYKTVRCWIRYNEYRINLENHPVYSYIERTSKLRLSLLQFFLRTPFYIPTDKIPYIPSSSVGRSSTVIRTDVLTDYLSSDFNSDVIPDDITQLFDKFDNLKEKEKSIFFNAIHAYCNGRKSKGSIAVAFYVVSIEALAVYEATEKGLSGLGKPEMIYQFLQETFPNTQVSKSYISDVYYIRNNYFHNGIANNDFIDEIFIKSVFDNMQAKKIERVANFALILWLMKK